MAWNELSVFNWLQIATYNRRQSVGCPSVSIWLVITMYCYCCCWVSIHRQSNKFWLHAILNHHYHSHSLFFLLCVSVCMYVPKIKWLFFIEDSYSNTRTFESLRWYIYTIICTIVSILFKLMCVCVCVQFLFTKIYYQYAIICVYIYEWNGFIRF